MIHKSELLKKYVEFIDANGAFRICRVVRISGNTLTVMDALKRRERVESAKVLAWIHHGHVKEPIDWSIRRESKQKDVIALTLKEPADVVKLHNMLEEVLGE